MAHKTNPEHINKLAREDKILETDLLKRYEAAEDPKVKHALKSEWKKRHPFKNFENHLTAYHESKDGRLNAEVEIKDRVKLNTKISIQVLREELDLFYTKKGNILHIWQRFDEEGLKSADLLGGDYQDNAIKVVFEHNHDMGATLLSKLRSADAKVRAEALDLVENIKTYMDKYRETTEKSVKTVREFEEGVILDEVKEGFRNALDYYREKPMVAVGSMAVFAVTYWYFGIREDHEEGKDKHDKWGTKALKVLAGAGMIGGSVWAINNGFSAFRDDEKSMFDILLQSKDLYKSDKVNQLFKDEVFDLTDDNRAAYEAMTHLGETKGSTIAEAFDHARRNGKSEIDPRVLYSSKEVSVDRARQADAKGLYIGSEALMKIIAERKLGMSQDDPEAVHMGLQYFKDHYGDRKLVYILNEIYADTKMGHARNPDGSNNESDPKVIEDKARLFLSDSDIKEKEAVTILYTQHNVDGTVEHRGNGVITVNGYPYKYSYNAETGKHEFKDIIGDKSTLVVDENKGTKETLKAVAAHSAKQMTEKYKQQIDANTTIEFDKEKGSWVVKGGRNIKAIPGMGQADTNVTVLVKAGDTNYLSMYREDSNTPYTSFDALTREAYDAKVKDRIEKDLAFKLGTTPFILKDIKGDQNRGEYTIQYEGVKGTIVYKNGQIESVNLPHSPALVNSLERTADAEFERRFASMRVGDKSAEQVFKDLQTAFEGKWTEAGATGVLEGLKDRIAGRWGEKTPLFYDREANWKEAVNAKKSEFKMSLKAGIAKILSENPKLTARELDKKVQALFDASAQDLAMLDRKAREISGSKIQEDFDRTIVTSIDEIEEFGYKSRKYRGFMNAVEAKVNNHALDYVGNDGMSYARRVRLEIKNIVFKYTMPIAALSEGEIKDKHEQYMAHVLDNLDEILQEALKSKNARINYIVAADERIDVRGFEEAFEARIKPFTEYKSDFRSSTADVLEVIDGKQREKVDEALAYSNEELDEIFEPVEKLDGWFADKFTSLVGLRKQQLSQELTDMALKSSDRQDFEAKSVKILDKARNEAMEFKQFNEREDAYSPQVLREATHKLVDNMLERPEWNDASNRVLKFLTTNFEFESTVLLDNPEILVDIYKIYLDKISHGKVETTEEEANKYAEFFVKEMSKRLPHDPNLSIDNYAFPAIRQVSDREWAAAVGPMGSILSFEDLQSQSDPEIEEAA